MTRRRQDLVSIQPLFDAGTYRETGLRFSNDADIFFELRTLSERVGIPVSLGHVGLLTGHFRRGLELSRNNSSVWMWAALSYSPYATEEDLNRWFGRLDVACMPVDVVETAATRLQDLINQHLDKTLRRERQDVTRVGRWLEVLSRLVMRLSPAAAAKLFDWGASLANSPQFSHHWLHEHLEHLLKRCLAAQPPLRRNELAGPLLLFPLPGEAEASKIRDSWPELVSELPVKAYSIAKTLQSRVDELIRAVATDDPPTRTRAILRLAYVHEAGALVDDQQREFAKALWANTTGQGLPEHTDLYAHVFLTLPEPEPGRAAAGYREAVLQPIARGGVTEYILVSLDGAARDQTLKGLLGSDDIAAVFDVLGSWTPVRQSRSASFPDPERRITELIGRVLAKVLRTQASADALGAQRINALAERLIQGKTPSLLSAAADVARLNPEYAERMVSLIRRGLASRDKLQATNALYTTDVLRRDSSPAHAFPPALATDVASICAARREPALLNSLWCLRRLLLDKLLSSPDIDLAIDALESLLSETSYENWNRDDPRTPIVSLLRAECVRMAQDLKTVGVNKHPVDAWLGLAGTDPIPEVRYALEESTHQI